MSAPVDVLALRDCRACGGAGCHECGDEGVEEVVCAAPPANFTVRSDTEGFDQDRQECPCYKAVNDRWTTDRGFDYSPGAKPGCSDFSDTDECGGGLHFGPTPRHARVYFDSATKFVAAGIKLSELRPITGATAKCKAPRVVRAWVEVDIDGRPIEVTS